MALLLRVARRDPELCAGHALASAMRRTDLGGTMNCYFCSSEGTPAVALGTCIECGCAACERHGAVDLIVTSVRTGNMFEERPAQARRFRCFACRSLIARQSERRVTTAAAG